MKPNVVLITEGVIYGVIGVLTPIASVLGGDTPLTGRTKIAMIIAGVIAGCNAVKAFLSTTFADSNASVQPGTLARAERFKHKS